MTGADTVEADTLQAARLQIDASGHGAVDVKAGEVGSVLVDDDDASFVSIGATVSDASVSATGAVRLARVTGRFSKDVTGAASVSVLRR